MAHELKVPIERVADEGRSIKGPVIINRAVFFIVNYLELINNIILIYCYMFKCVLTQGQEGKTQAMVHKKAIVAALHSGKRF